MAGKLQGRAISNTANIVSQTITVGNSTSNSAINSTAVVTPSVNVGSNVFVNTSTIHLGNSTVNTVIHTTGFTGNGAGLHGINASSIATGTLDTARLPSTVNVSTAINVGANLNINTSTIFIGNSTVNTTIIAGNVNLQGTELRVGNVVVNGNQLSVGNVTITDAQISVGNSTVNTVLGSTGSLSGNGSQLTSVNAIALEGNSVANILTSANTAANTLAAAAFTNAASRADAAYSNAVSYAASNTYVNNTFLPLAGGTLTGALTINATANVVANLAANNVVVRGDIQIDGNLTVTGTSVTLNVASLAVEDNMIYLNGGSQVSHPDLGIAGNYNDGSYKHAGFFRDATDGVWKVFDGYTPEPDASAFIDTSNASFRIANFTANVITANSFSGNGASITSVNAATVGGNTASTLRTYSDTVAATAYSNAISYSGNAALAYSNATTYASNADNISSGTLNTARLPATVNVSTVINVGANVNANTSTLFIGNSTINTSISAATILINGVNVNTSITSNAATAYSNATTYASNADNISSGTLNTARLPATVNVSTIVNVGANAYVNTSAHFVGNSTVNSILTSTTLSIGGNTATFGTAAYVVANGNVGIGTSSPASKLEITDAAVAGTKIDGLRLSKPLTDFANYLAFQQGANGWRMGINYNDNTYPFVLYYGASTPTAASPGTEMFRVAANGNVGIGTTSPAGMLDVSSSATSNNTYFRVTSNTTSSYIQHYFLANTAFMRIGVTAPAYTGWSGDSWIYASRGLVLSANDGSGGVATYFAANGNVGVGTMSPAGKLDISGGSYNTGLIIRSASTSGTGINMKGNDTGGHDWYLISTATGNGGGAGNLGFYDGSVGAYLVYFTGGGNVGIGTNNFNPTHKLDVRGTGTVAKFLSSNTTVGIAIEHSGNGGTIGYTNNGAGDLANLFYITTGAGTVGSGITMDNGGRVGVGTTSPGTKFHVVSADSISGSWTRTAIFQGPYPVLVFHSTSAQNKFGGIGYDSGTSDGWRFWGNASTSDVAATTPLFNILNNGNVSVLGTLTENSSILIKENIKPIDNALNVISSLVGVTYDRKDGSAKQRPGLIAEEVDKILPNIVVKDENGAPSSIAYTNLIAYLVESIKELKAEIDILKSK